MTSGFTEEVVLILEHIPTAFYALDNKMNFIYANKRVQLLLNKAHDEIYGRNIWELLPSWVDSSLHHKLTDALKTGQITHLEEYYPPLEKWFEMYCYPSSEGLAIYINDITDRKTTESYLAVLNRTGELLATTHDLDEALEKLGALIVPEHADWFTVDVVRNNKVELLRLENADPVKRAWGVEYRNRTEINLEKPKPGSVAWVIRLGFPVLLNNVTEDIIDAAASDAEHREVLRQLEIKSAIIVPMPFREKNIGAVTMLSSRPAKQYTERDLSFAKDLAIRIAISVDHARVSEEAKKAFAFRIRHEGIILSEEAKEKIRSSGLPGEHTPEN